MYQRLPKDPPLISSHSYHTLIWFPPPSFYLSLSHYSISLLPLNLDLPPRKSRIKSRDQRLRKPERKHQLGTGHEQLGHETLEEGAGALVLGHVGQDAEARLGVVKVAVLDAGLDDIEGGRNDKRRRSAGDGGDEVLEPRCLVVVVEAKEKFLRKGGTTKELCDISLVMFHQEGEKRTECLQQTTQGRFSQQSTPTLCKAQNPHPSQS